MLRARFGYIQEDLPKPIKTAQRSLYQAFKKAKSMSDTFSSVQLKGTKLIIDGKAYGEGDMDALPLHFTPPNWLPSIWTRWWFSSAEPHRSVTCKGILNELRDDNTDKWEEILEEVVTDGLTAKFSQNPELAQFLVDTFLKALGEASLNKRWGIGLPLNNPEALDPSKWVEGGNLLGRKLTQVRA